MEVDVDDFVRQCLHCVDSKAGELDPCPLGQPIHREGIGEVSRFYFHHVGGGWPLGNHGVGNVARKSIFAINEDVSDYGWLESAAACPAAVTGETLLCSCAAMGVPRVSVRATARHFKNRTLQSAVEALDTPHRFAVANLTVDQCQDRACDTRDMAHFQGDSA